MASKKYQIHTQLKMEKNKMFKRHIQGILDADQEDFIRSGGSVEEWRESGILVDVVDTRHDTTLNIIEPKVRLSNQYGTFEAWVNDGESARDISWQEV